MNKRRLAPMLTITLPSTEELSGTTNADTVPIPLPPPPPPLPPPPTLPSESSKVKVSSKPPLSPHPEEKHLKAALQPRNKLHEETSPTQQKDLFKRQSSGGSAGTSPPTPRRPSKWSKVKNAFLTSGAGNDECLHRGSNSVPSSPVKASSFLYDLESDELSSGEFIDDNQKDNDDVFQEPMDEVCDFGRNENIHAEIQRNFEELQLKLSHEFHKKLCEWERMKNSGVGTPPSGTRIGGSGVSSGTSSVGEETPHDKGFRRKMEEWERIKGAGASCSKHRESVALHQLGEENLSADFRKKLEQWEKIKSVPVPQTPDSLGSSQLQFKKKITEWQKWRHGGSTKIDVQIMSPSSELPEDFHRKLQEWERLKQSSITGAASENDSPGNKTPSPGSCRREFTDNKSKKSQHSPTGVKEKWSDSSGGGQFKVHKSKHHEVKELAWLEKELHKIEREKQRLERERDKYLEREARLEKMRRAIGSGMKKQEVLIPTSTGLFRFQGISQKFTRKLYEWEKARGIGPEESTFALLDPGYQPPLKSGMVSKVSGEPSINNGALLTRSKSVGSVADLVVTGNQSNLTHQPSSLSLNNVEQLESSQLDSVLQGSDEGDLCSHHHHLDDEEPEAMIVDIEDVIEETAGPLEETPAIETQTPVYCYAPEEVTRLIDSSGSEKDQIRQSTVTVANDEAVHSSYQLLQENITLLNKLKMKGDICRQLEYKMEDLEGQLNIAAKIHKEELGHLAEAEDKPFILENDGTEKADCTHLAQIKARLHELECHQELLRREGETLQYSFAEHSEQQAALAQHLVGKVKQLQEANINISTGESKEQSESSDNYSDSKREDTLAAVQDLTSQLLNMAEKLEIAIGERNQEILRLRKALGSRGRSAVTHNLRSSQHWFSTDSMSSVGVTDYEISHLPRQSSEELAQLPSLLTNKVLELKRGLSYLCAASDMSTKIPQEVKSPDVVTPASPEVDTTFTFKFGKSPNPSSTHFVGEEASDRGPLEPSEPASPVTTTYTFTPAFMKKNLHVVSSDGKEEDMKPYDSEDSCKCNNRTQNEISCMDEHKTFVYDFNNAAAEDTVPAVYIKRKSLDLKNIPLSFNVDDDDDDDDNEDEFSKESVNKMVRKQRRESGERFGNFDRWRIKQNYELDADDDDEDGGVDDNDCDKLDNNNEFETNVSKRITVKNAKSKKLLKTRRITDTHVMYDRNNDEASNEIKLPGATGTDETPTRSCENRLEDTNSDEDKRSSSHKLVTRRLKKFTRKNSKDESNKYCGESLCVATTNNFSTNYFNNNDNNETNTAMAVNVFVPTTRKIFSPVRRDSKGKASSVIGYVVDEPESAPVMSQNVDIFSRNIDNFQQNRSKTETENRLCVQLETDFNTKTDSIENGNEPGFIMPPCWILKQTRAQSASPALQRRLFTYSRSREKEEDTKGEKEVVTLRKPSTTEQQSELNTSQQMENSKGENTANDLVNNNISNETKEHNIIVTESQYTLDTNNVIKDDNKDDNNNKNNPNCELSSADNLKPIKKDTIGLPNLKLRTEAGFPPISPLSVRKEVKSPQKETAPSIRMMIARYNQKVTESQEVAGSKSPESGSASPIAWCSPATKRRVKAQMERYQEEVQRHLQNWVRRDFAGKAEVKKSASAGYIRSPDKEDGIHDLASKSPSEESGCRQIKLGILKSSSAGVIKTTSPLPVRAEKPLTQTADNSSVNNSTKILPSVVCDFKSNQFSDSKTDKVSEISGACALAKDDSGSSVFSQSSPQTSRARALKIKKAKEEFLSRGPGGESWSSECGGVSENDSSNQMSPGIRFNETRNRLSQVSCESESSYDGGGGGPISEQQRSTAADDDDDVILTKSASAGMINVDSSTCNRIFNDQQNIQQSSTSEQGVIPKSRFGIFSRFRKARMRRHKEKNPKLEAVSTLCRQSLVVDIQRKRGQEEKEPVASTSKSCPSSPVLQKRDPQSSSWIRNPKKIFKPK